jgi:hypothetical protein
MLFCVQANALESLSYSGRLVQANGSPVTGPVNLKAELVYTNNTSVVLCSDDISGVILSKGVFHVKLDFACTGGKTLTQVLSQAPANETVAIQIIDVSNSKAYSFQALHAIPYANVSTVATQLDQNGAADGEFLKWNNTNKKWEPGGVSGASGGTVTNVSVSAPLNLSNPTTTPSITLPQANTTTSGYLSAADWNAFNGKEGSIAGGTAAEFYRGDKSWRTLDTSAVPENVNLYFTNTRALGVPLTGFSSATGAVVATDTVLAALGKLQGQINLKSDSASFVDWSTSGVQTINPARLNLGVGNADKVVVTDASGFVITGGASGSEVGYLTGVTSNIQTQLNSKQATITSASNLSTGTLTSGEIRLNELAVNGTEYTGFKSPSALTANVIYTLPLADGSNGQVLTTNSTGGLSWTTVATGSSSLTGDIGGSIGANTIGAGKVTLTHLSATGTKDNSTYFRGDNTWSSFKADVQASVLSTYVLGSNAVLAATDSVVGAFGKLQKQISDFTVSAVGGDLAGNLPNPTVVKIRGTTVSSTAPLAGQVLKYNSGTPAWEPSYVLVGDLKSSALGNLFPGTGCATNQTLYYSVVGDAFSCVNIDSLDGNKITTGTIAAARLPLSASYWSAATGGINYAGGGNVGIGTSTPTDVLEVVGKVKSIRAGVPGQNIYIYGGDATNQQTYLRSTTIESNKKPLHIQSLNDGSGSPSGVGGFLFQTGNTTTQNTVMSISEAGNVGIGTTAPAQKLDLGMTDVIGSQKIQFNVAGTDVGFIESERHTATGRLSNLHLGTMGSRRMTIDNNGNVGIGLTSPISPLHLKSTAATGGVPAATGTSDPGIWTRIEANTAVLDQGFLSGGPVWLQPRSRTDLSVNFNLLLNPNGGRVGIAHTSPQTLLDLGSTGYTYKKFITLDGSESTRYSGNIGFGDFTGSNKFGLSFGTRNNNVDFDKTLNIIDGAVGIGTTVPTARLDVRDTLGVSSSGYPSIILTNEAKTGSMQGLRWHLYNMSAPSYSNGLEFWAYDTTGCTGGLCQPQFKMLDDGNAWVRGGLTQASDKRLKKNIVPLTSSLEKIISLDGVYYHWISPVMDQSRQIGLIAQRVQKVFPEVVKKNSDGFLSVSYSSLIAPVIESIKELYSKIVGQEKSIQENHRAIASLKVKTQDELKKKDQEILELKNQNEMMRKYLCAQNPKAPFCLSK